MIPNTMYIAYNNQILQLYEDTTNKIPSTSDIDDTTMSPIKDQLNGIFPIQKTVIVPINKNKYIVLLSQILIYIYYTMLLYQLSYTLCKITCSPIIVYKASTAPL